MADTLVNAPRRAAAWFRALPPERRLAPALAAAVLLSGFVLAAAVFFQYVMSLAPCKLCIVQRYPHAAVLGLGLAGLALAAARLPARALAGVRAGLLAACGVAFLYTGGYGVYHTGAERGWWPGPADCTGGVMPSDFAAFNALLTKGEEVVRCDEAPWSFLGLSMASYNALFSIAAAILVFAVAGSFIRERMSAPRRAGQHG